MVTVLPLFTLKDMNVLEGPKLYVLQSLATPNEWKKKWKKKNKCFKSAVSL